MTTLSPCLLHCDPIPHDCRLCEQRGVALTERVALPAFCEGCGRALYADDSAVLYHGHTARRVCGRCALKGVRR